MTIKVQVKLFATLRRYYPELELGERMRVELPPGATVEQLIDHLALPREQVKIVFVNGLVKENEHKLEPGDEVGIFPPVGGG
jgi:molybdopterin converting factor small subunit